MATEYSMSFKPDKSVGNYRRLHYCACLLLLIAPTLCNNNSLTMAIQPGEEPQEEAPEDPEQPKRARHDIGIQVDF